MAVAPSWVADTVDKLPPKLPIGVLTADTMTTSFMNLIFARIYKSLFSSNQFMKKKRNLVVEK